MRKFQVGAQELERIANLFGRADRRRRFEDNDIANLQHRRDAACSSEDVADIGGMIVVERCGHGDQENVGPLYLGRRAQKTTLHDALHQRIEIDLLDVHAPRIDGIDDSLVDIDAEYRRTRPGDNGCRRQTDIAETEDGDFCLMLRGH